MGRSLTFSDELRAFILRAEFGALLHDFGKLSSFYLAREAYEQTPYDDYGEHLIFDDASQNHDKDGLLKGKDGREINGMFWERCSNLKSELINYIVHDDYTLKDAIDRHHPPRPYKGGEEEWSAELYSSKKGDWLSKFVMAADGVDSTADKSQPGVLQRGGQYFRATPFGIEEPVDDLDARRQEFAKGLTGLTWPNMLPNLEDFRRQTYELVGKYFSKGLARTRRAANEVTLYDHCYVTATLFKAFLVADIVDFAENNGKDLTAITPDEYINGNGGSFAKKPLEILKNERKENEEDKGTGFFLAGLRWEGLRFLNRGQRVADAAGRYKRLEYLQNELKRVVEVDLCWGNEVYRDRDGIYFLLADGILAAGRVDMAAERFVSLLKDRETVGGELEATLVYKRATSLTDLPRLFTTAGENNCEKGDKKDDGDHADNEVTRKPLNTFEPMAATSSGDKAAQEKRVNDKSEAGSPGEICPACGLRVADPNTGLCAFCRGTRVDGVKVRREKEKTTPVRPTVFIDEIADDRNYVALLTLELDLRSFLSGVAMPTLFNFSLEEWGTGAPKEKEGETPFRPNEKGATAAKFRDAEAIIRELKIDLKISNYAGTAEDWMNSFLDFKLKGRETPADRLKQVKKREFLVAPASVKKPAHLLNLLMRKHPTPGRLMRVWTAAEQFVAAAADAAAKHAPIYSRVRLDVLRGGLIPNLAYEILASAGARELVGYEIIFEKRDDDAAGVYWLIGRGDRLEKALSGNGAGGFELTVALPEKRDDPKDLKVTGWYPRDGKFSARYELARWPDRLDVVIPAATAPDVLAEVIALYERHFGKVRDRLPVKVGVVFFKHKTPLYLVRDAASRLNRAGIPAQRAPEKWTAASDAVAAGGIALTWTTPGGRRLDWRVRATFGDCSADRHHFNLTLTGDQMDAATRATYIKVPAGDAEHPKNVLFPEVVHGVDIKQGDRVFVKPSYVDFEFLDVAARRYGIYYEDGAPGTAGVRRNHPLMGAQGRRPFYLEEYEVLERLRRILGKKDATQRENLRALLETRAREWLPDNAGAYDAFTTWAARHFAKDADAAALEAACRDGTVFDVLDFYFMLSGKSGKGGENEVDRKP